MLDRLRLRQRPHPGLPHGARILCKLVSVADPNSRKPKIQSDYENDTNISPYIQTSAQQCVSPTWTQTSNPNSVLKTMPENVSRASPKQVCKWPVNSHWSWIGTLRSRRFIPLETTMHIRAHITRNHSNSAFHQLGPKIRTRNLGSKTCPKICSDHNSTM